MIGRLKIRPRTLAIGLTLFPLLAWALAFPRRTASSEVVRVEVAFPHLRFDRPLYITYPPDGTDRLFVLGQRGVVSWFERRRDVEEAHVALDISEKVRMRHNEEGLLGLAFHPRFRENRQLFLMYSASEPRRNVLSRFRMDERRRRILPETEEVLLEVTQPWGNHNGGMLAFGPDDYLYVSFGDGGAAADPYDNAQNKGVLLGKILRLDVDRADPGLRYAIPEDNPFVGELGARPEIWAWGLRNVWRFSFDRETDGMWAGDVGQWDWEEINIIEKGKNYGWDYREGAHPYTDKRKSERKTSDVPPSHLELVDPVVEHNRREARSITGGYVYRGERVPSLRGAYMYADYVTDHIWMLRYENDRVTRHEHIGSAPAIASFGEDRNGELYMTCFDGRIYSFFPRSQQRSEPVGR